MDKKKLAAPNDPSIKLSKIQKIATPGSTQTQPLSQLINSNQVIDPNAALIDNLDELTQIWNSAKKNELNLPQDQAQVQFDEMKNRLAQSELEIERLQNEVSEGKEKMEELSKNVENQRKIRKKVIEDQNLMTDLDSQREKHLHVIRETLKECQESEQHFTTLYNNMYLELREKKKNLTQLLNDKTLKKKKKLEEELELKCRELSTLETGMEEFKKIINEKSQRQNELNIKHEESKVIIEENKKRYAEETSQLLKIIKEIESNLEFEKKEKEKLEIEVNEDSMKYNELSAKYKELRVTDSEYQSQVEDLISKELELKEEQTRLTNELDELKNNHLALIANEDPELTETRKQLQDSTLIHKETTDKLREAILKNEKLSKTVDGNVAEEDLLKKSIKNYDHEILNIGTNLNDILNKNKKINGEIQIKNQDLITIETQICKNNENATKLDEAAKRENEIIQELAMIDQQLSNESEEIAKLLEEEGNVKIKSAEEVKRSKQDIKENDDLITKEKKDLENLQREIGRKRSMYLKKIQDATRASKQCESAGHRKQIKEQDDKIDALTRELSGEQLKRKQANAEKNVIDAREKEEHARQLKTMETDYENLKKKLSAMKAEYEIRQSELKEAENPPQETAAITCIMPKPILKSATRNSPLKVQKVKFDLGPSLDTSTTDIVSEMFEKAERRAAAVPIGAPGRPDWANINISTPAESNTTSVTTESQTAQVSQPRKFFKNFRPSQKKSPR